VVRGWLVAQQAKCGRLFGDAFILIVFLADVSCAVDGRIPSETDAYLSRNKKVEAL
jgi:hypothetical protein